MTGPRPFALALLLCLSAIMTASAFGAAPARAAASGDASPRPVVTETIDDNMQSERAVPGTISARVEVVLGFQTLGRVVARNVDIGDRVRGGEVLASIDPDDLAGNVIAADAAVEATAVRLQTAVSTAERTRELVRRNVASAAQLERAENALVAAGAAHSQSLSELTRARDAEGYANMAAPFGGVVSAVFVNPGAVVSAGQPVVQLSDDNALEAVIDLPEPALAGIARGDRFEVWSDMEQSRTIPATVRVIEPMADAATRTRRLRLALQDANGFRLGTLINARPLRDESLTVTIPPEALRNLDGVPHVWVVATSGDERRVSLRPVTLGGTRTDGRHIVTDGLEQGDEIVIRGVNSLSDGQMVGVSVRP